MDKKFYAHTRPINENGVERTEYQLLSDHERGVGTLCGQFAEAFGAQAEAAQYALFILTVDWLGWLCYSLIIGFPSLSIKGQIPPPVPNFATR